MRSARTKQLLILGNRRNRTNDLLRALSARCAVDPEISTSSAQSTRVMDTRATLSDSTARRTRMYKRLNFVEPKVDTGLRRRRRNTRESPSPVVVHIESKPEVSEASSSDESRDVSPTHLCEDEILDETMDANNGDEDEIFGPPRIRIRKRSVREAREALIILRARPLSPKSVEKFRKALESIRAQRTLVDLSLLRAYNNSNLNEHGQLDSLDDDVKSDAEPDRVEDYDPSEQVCEEFVSVWGAVAHESRDLLRGEPMASMKEVEHHLLENYPAIRNIFKYYSSLTKPFDENITASELGSMTLADWMQFVKDCKLIGPHPKHQLVKSSAELLFIRLNWVTDEGGRKVKNQDMSNSDRTLIMPEFMCGILRLAKQCGVHMETLGLTASKFIEEIVCARAHSVDVEEFRTRMRFRSARAMLQKYATEISTVFARYAASEASDRVGAGLETLDFKEFMNLCRALEIVSAHDDGLLAPLAAQHVFALSQLQVVGDDAGEIDADEFFELISRTAESFFDTFFTAIYNAAAPSSPSSTASTPSVLSHALALVHPREIILAHKLAWFLPRLDRALA
jgi:hypothetical protein